MYPTRLTQVPYPTAADSLTHGETQQRTYPRTCGPRRSRRTCLIRLLLPMLLASCTTANSLKPGVPRGTDERGYVKTTEGFAIRITNRPYDEVWSAADKVLTARLRVVDRDKNRGVLRAADEDFVGYTRSYVGVFITPVQPTADSYLVEVSKIMHARWHVLFPGSDWEDELLRAIQKELLLHGAVQTPPVAVGPVVAPPVVSSASPQLSDVPADLLGHWRSTGTIVGTLRIGRAADGKIQWDYESGSSVRLAAGSVAGTTVYRARGAGTVSDHIISLVGRYVEGDTFVINGPLTFNLRRDGVTLKGIVTGPVNALVPVEFIRQEP